MEHRVVILVMQLFDEFKGHFHPALLAPFDESRLEVHFFARHLVEVDVVLENLLLYEELAAVVALIQIDGADEGFESIAIHVAVVRGGAGGVLHQLVQSDFHGEFVQCFALHDFGAGVGEESFATAFEMLVDDVAHDGVEDGVAQKFQTFVVDEAPFLRAHGDGFVQQGLLIDFDVTREESEDSVKTKIRLSVLVEQEPYFIYLVT